MTVLTFPRRSLRLVWDADKNADTASVDLRCCPPAQRPVTHVAGGVGPYGGDAA